MAIQVAPPKPNPLICVQCGVCVGSCPITDKSPLSARKLVRGFATKLLEAPDESIWDCTTCLTCQYRCPRGTRPLDLIIKLRSASVEEGRVPPTVGEALENMFKYGNPWGRSKTKRVDWASGLGLKTASDAGEIDVLLFTCCASAYDERAQAATRALARLLVRAGVDFAILGEEEACCGNEAYNMGELGLFEELMSSNLESFSRYKPSLIVTTSPHCYNAMKNRYGGLPAEIRHYTQYLLELVDAGKLEFGRSEAVVTYHDPCYLGRHNGVYDEPRNLLETVPGVELVEMWRSRERSLCCEGGGGRMWFEGPPGRRLSERRVEEALATGASVLAVACPFCLADLEDAAKSADVEERLKVLDVAEVLALAAA